MCSLLVTCALCYTHVCLFRWKGLAGDCAYLNMCCLSQSTSWRRSSVTWAHQQWSATTCVTSSKTGDGWSSTTRKLHSRNIRPRSSLTSISTSECSSLDSRPPMTQCYMYCEEPNVIYFYSKDIGSLLHCYIPINCYSSYLDLVFTMKRKLQSPQSNNTVLGILTRVFCGTSIGQFYIFLCLFILTINIRGCAMQYGLVTTE